MADLIERIRAARRALRFRRRFGFAPPPEWSDMARYEELLEAYEERGLDAVPGDIVEIGAFLGGGTYKLCKYFERRKPRRLVVAVDAFDPGLDGTRCEVGCAMSEVYERLLNGRDQAEVFAEVTRTCTNLLVVKGDSAAIELPVGAVALAFIDGNHADEYVRSDFALIWGVLSPGGVVALHDYDHDLPGVTRTVHELVGEHAREISRVWSRHITVFIERRR